MRHFELIEGNSRKFWEIEQDGTDLNIRWGRIGTAGQSQTKSFADAVKAAAALDKLVGEKTRKGYTETETAAKTSIGNTAPKAAASAPDTTPAATPIEPASATVSVEPTSTPESTPPWLADGEPVLITRQMREIAWASRRFPQPVPTLTLADAWQRVQQTVGTLDVILDATDEPLRAAAKRAGERMALSEPPPDPEADALLLARALRYAYQGECKKGKAVVDYLVARYGLPQAVDIWLAAHRVQITPKKEPRMGTSYFSTTVEYAMYDDWNGPFGQPEETLRRYLAAASEDEWNACAERIKAALPTLHVARRPAQAMLLPECPELSDAMAELSEDEHMHWILHWLLLTARDPAALEAFANLRFRSGAYRWWRQPHIVATVVLERGVDAITILAPGAEEDAAGEALTAIGTPEAVTVLAKLATSGENATVRKSALARVSRSAGQWPLAALVALARSIAAGGKDAAPLLPVFTGLVRTHRNEIDRLRPWLDADAQAVIDRQLARLSGPSETAETSELPEVLRAPPWLAKSKKKAANALELEPLPLAPVEQWEPGERESSLKLEQWQQEIRDKAAHDVDYLIGWLGFFRLEPATRKAVATAIGRRDTQGLIALWNQANRRSTLNGPIVTLLPPELAVPLWNAAIHTTGVHELPFAMASLGLAALPGLQALAQAKPGEHMELALNFGSVELAATAARAFAKLKTVRDTGQSWLIKYPEHTACALIAPALGKPGEARDCATAALRLLHAQGHEALLFEVAARYQNPAVIEALRAVLDESPLDRFPAKRAKLPAWWQPRNWSTPVLLNGKALPFEAIDHLGQMLTFPAHEEIYAGITDVKAACEPDSLIEFAWDVFQSWLANGAPGKDNWALTALGILGNDEIARRLTPLIRAWPGESAHARAVTALDVLAAIGTDVALMLLNGIAQKLKFKGLQDKAREKIDAIAEARGLTTEELEDRLAPDLGLDERGTLRLDFGPRAFSVGFDETLKPYVRELDAEGRPGKRMSDLPKPKQTDDAGLSKAAVDRFKLLKKDARTIANQQVLRLETAMCTRRRWTPELEHFLFNQLQ